jgi:hypothetical protein
VITDQPYLLAQSPYQPPAISPSLPSVADLIQRQFPAPTQPSSLAPIPPNVTPQGNAAYSNAPIFSYSLPTNSTGTGTLYTLQPLATNNTFPQYSGYNPAAMPLQNLPDFNMTGEYSGDLANISLSGLLDNTLSDSLSGKLNLTEVEPSRGDIEAPMNMSTDSITRLTLDTYDKEVLGTKQ